MKMTSSSSLKSISSPGRVTGVEKFQAPLIMRLLWLRSNNNVNMNVVNNNKRSRPKLRSPLFLRKRKTIAGGPESHQEHEPSSPKVTCIGQVRVRRPNRKNKQKKKAHHRRPKCECKCSCSCCRPVWRFWARVFCCCSNRVDEERESVGHEEQEKEVDVEERENVVSGSGSGSGLVEESTVVMPPKNALMLTRSRSAPYRSSSLAGRFWGGEREERESKREVETTVALETETCGRDSAMETRGRRDVETEEIHQSQSPSPSPSPGPGPGPRESVSNSGPSAGGGNGSNSMAPGPGVLVLMRCKSEPRRSRSGEDPLTSEFWKKS